MTASGVEAIVVTDIHVTIAVIALQGIQVIIVVRDILEITVVKDFQVATEIQGVLVVAKDIQIVSTVETKIQKEIQAEIEIQWPIPTMIKLAVFIVKAHHIEFVIVKKLHA